MRGAAWVHLGLALEHVEPRGEQPAFLERDGQRLLVDDRAARRVDKDGRRLQKVQPPVGGG